MKIKFILSLLCLVLTVLIMIFCNFIQQLLRADDFQIPPHRQAVQR